ncbi:Structural maintenance of chromosomes protein 5 [Cladophialophora chaetospira]|uniref:Structural maintenance of chromosomes protein 5 n=1 Tax=Cladophialophora chaetospira TaxID=386627 RepID=A0AA38XKW2_9EURO|nr:Structural maintenance of chromosomes protein 5 [Cladophialophora chaetospira]
MAPLSGRRSRALDSDDDGDDSRPNTPASTTPNDGKRIRLADDDDNDDDDDGDDSATEETSRPAITALPSREPQVSAGPSHANIQNRSSHQPGAIVRVKLTNFVTYTSAEFFPGPNLNMVIGPNGTGKSTLVCAICLGLGWGPKYLGRAKEPAEFVKHGSREAVIEIELQRNPSMRKNPVITRRIKREGNLSTYLTNGKQTSGREVQLLASSFNIQIDNLCQFLPQDKVVEFAQLSPIDLLTSTQRAVAGSDMIKYHEDLKKLRTSHSAVIKEDQQAQGVLTELQDKQEHQRGTVERMKARAKIQLRLERLKQSRIMLEYRAAKETADDAKERAKVLTQELSQLKAISAPNIAKLNSKKTYEAAALASKTSLETDLTAALRNCDVKAKSVTEIGKKVDAKAAQIVAEIKGITEKQASFAREKKKIESARRQKNETPQSFDVTAITNEIQVLRGRSNALHDQLTELDQTKVDLGERSKKRKEDVEDLTAKLESFDTHASQQEEKLKAISLASFKAWAWVQKNQDQFGQHVYGPPIVECSLKDPGTADAVETFLQQQSDFTFITVQSNADYRLLQQKLVGSTATGGLGLHDVSLRVCSNSSLDQFRPPVAREQIERLGLTGWAIDCLRGPETVLAQLCHERSLHRCGYSSREPTTQQHEELAKTDIQSYVAGQRVYRFMRRREYGAAGNSASVQDVRPARVWTDQPVDVGRKAALQRDLNEANGEYVAMCTELKDMEKQMKQVQVEKKKFDAEWEAKKAEKGEIQRARLQYEALDIKIQNAENTMRALRDSLQGVRARTKEFQDEFDELVIKKTEAVLDFALQTREIRSMTASLLEADVILIEAASDREIMEAQNTEVVQAIHQKTTEQTDAKELYRQQLGLARSVKDAVSQLVNESRRLAEEGDNSFVELLEHVCQTLNSTENLEAEIGAEQANLELTEGGNADTISEYEQRAKKIERLQVQIQETSRRQEDFKHAIREVRGKWEPRLDEVVGRINDAFSDSFARIGCAGQVAVHKASSDDPVECTEENGGLENGLDFDHWAIHISVKFRESEPLSLLDSHRQSGGERAVSTIFYLMALQSLSRAPFRVVDEINQGMDPRNERMVHGRMVDIAADDGGSQYFLITPKLLSGLKYRRGMTVLCIVSGENVPAARERDGDGDWQDGPKIDFRLFAKRARELGIGGPTSKRIDPGMSLGRSFTASQSPAVGA